MARRKKTELKEIADLLCYAISKYRGKSLAFFLMDNRSGTVLVGQTGNMEMPLEPLVRILNSPTVDALFDNMREHLSREALENLYSLIGSYLDEEEELETEDDESPEVVLDGNLPCSGCARFVEISHGFGKCICRDVVFDGTESNERVCGVPCTRYEGK